MMNPENTNDKPSVPENSSNKLDMEQDAMDLNNDVFDEADIASALEMGFIAQAWEKHKEKVGPEKHPDFDGKHCIDCEEPIPEKRLEMGRIRCFECQSFLETMAKQNKLMGR